MINRWHASLLWFWGAMYVTVQFFDNVIYSLHYPELNVCFIFWNGIKHGRSGEMLLVIDILVINSIMLLFFI